MITLKPKIELTNASTPSNGKKRNTRVKLHLICNERRAMTAVLTFYQGEEFFLMVFSFLGVTSNKH